MHETHANDGVDMLDTVGTRRDLLRRSRLLAGAGLAVLLVGCTRGDDDDDDDTEPGVPEDSGLDEGAEDPGEAPGVDEESGVEDTSKGEVEETEDAGD